MKKSTDNLFGSVVELVEADTSRRMFVFLRNFPIHQLIETQEMNVILIGRKNQFRSQSHQVI